MRYKVTILETLCRTVEVEAASRAEAERIVTEMYRGEEIVLTAEDYLGTDIASEPSDDDRLTEERI